MLTFISGAALVGTGVAAMAVCRARNGEAHWLVRMPGMETALALVIVCLLAGGIALLVSSFLV